MSTVEVGYVDRVGRRRAFWCASHWFPGATCIHFVAVHFVPLMTGHPAWLEPPSSSPPVFILQKSSTARFSGFTATPVLAQSLHFPVRPLGTAVFGKTVSPPSSTSARYSSAVAMRLLASPALWKK